MANIVNKADPSIFRRSVNTLDYDPSLWLVNPPSFYRLVDSVPSKYWKLIDTVEGVDTDITEMTGAEKAAIDLAETKAIETEEKTNAKNSYDLSQAETRVLRAVVEVLLRELNTLRALHSLPDRTMAQARTAIRNSIDGG